MPLPRTIAFCSLNLYPPFICAEFCTWAVPHFTQILLPSVDFCLNGFSFLFTKAGLHVHKDAHVWKTAEVQNKSMWTCV